MRISSGNNTEPAGRWEQLSGVDTLRSTLQHEAALQTHKQTNSHVYYFNFFTHVSFEASQISFVMGLANFNEVEDIYIFILDS